MKPYNLRTVGRPPDDNKKMPINVKLPPWLIEWMNRQPESRASLIETALIDYFQIPLAVQQNKTHGD